MLLWLMILISFLFAWIGFKKGFFVMFTILFNLMFAIFMAVFLTRWFMRFSSGYESSAYYAAIILFLIFLLVFGILEAFSYFYILRNREGYFPRFLDKTGSLVLGFLCGYIICALLIFVLCVMPCSVHGKVDWLSTRENMQTLSVPAIRKVCNFLGWYSLHCFDGDSEREIDYLLNLGVRKDSEQPPTLSRFETNLNSEKTSEESMLVR